MTVYVTSDLHLGHPGIINFRRGIYQSLEHHDRMIIDKWNSVVHMRDTVFVLGDFIWNREHLHYLNKLHGQINWILGNHDPKIKKYTLNNLNINFVGGIYPYKHGTVFSHVPIHPNELIYRWKYNIHGHIHLKNADINDPRYYNANVDIQGFKPVPFDYIMEILEGRNS